MDNVPSRPAPTTTGGRAQRRCRMPSAVVTASIGAACLALGLAPTMASATPVDWPCTTGTFTVNANVVTGNDGCTGTAAIPDAVTSINDEAFSGATGLTAVTFGAGSSLTAIGADAFSGATSLASITIPAGVTAIGGRAFSNATSLTALAVDPANTSYGTVDGVLTDAAQQQIVAYPAGRAGPYTVPAGITSIGDTAFQGTTVLTTITIPAGVTSIGGEAFSGSTGLTTVTFSQGSSLTAIGPYAFYGATSLTGITIPQGVTTIPPGAFGATTSLATVTFAPGSNLTTIDADAFNGASSLTSIAIPQGVTSIGDRAFENATALASVSIPASVTTISEPAFAFDTSLTAFTVDPANASFTAVDGVLMNRAATRLVQYPPGRAGAYVVPAGVTAIGVGAFGGATSLTGIAIPEGVTSIGIGAFSHATGLTQVTIPSTVTSISGWTFDTATGLTTVTLPATITSISYNAFVGATGLTDIRFLGNAPATVISGAFNGVTASARRLSTATGFGAGPTWRGLALGYWMPAPGAPSAVAQRESAIVTMTTPVVGPPPTSFTIDAVEDPSRTCTITGASGSCTISGLTAGSSYTFRATSTDGLATSAASPASAPVTPTGAPSPAPNPEPAPTPTASGGGQGTPTPPNRSPAGPPAPLRQTAPRQTGDAVVTTGLVPDSATSVMQVATRGARQAEHRSSATTRVTTRCAITASGSRRTFRCTTRLPAGRWTLTTQAMAGSTVVAQSVRAVRMGVTRPVAVAG